MVSGGELKRPVEHPVPTDATVKQLYGTALRCGRPGCPQRLYRVSETGERVLNSEVAHIHARREGGPRWNPGMSADENRGYDNLILLCRQHASEIDVTPSHFPAELLRDWKRAQVAAQQQAATALAVLSDAEAAAVLRESFPLDEAVAAIAGMVPFSPRLRARSEALDRAARQSLARRKERLPVAEGLREQVLLWMSEQADPVVQVPPGALRVLVAPMGWGKSEHAARWWDEALDAAQADPGTEIPVWFTARQIVSVDLEEAVAERIGGDPVRPCRVVVDGLDEVTAREAEQLLYEARQLASVWPRVQVLATSRPGVPASKEELIEVAPWTVERGLDLVRVVAGKPDWSLLTAEVETLLTSPLTALGVGSRLLEGRDVRVSRLALLRDLPRAILRQQRPGRASPQLWEELARLAARILSEPVPVAAQSFGNEAQVWDLTDTGLVVDHGGTLEFALPVFEQHFAAQALVGGIVSLEEAAGPALFPRWRYAVAFAVWTSEAAQAEDYMRRLAAANPGAASWVLGEIEAENDPSTGQMPAGGAAPASAAPPGSGQPGGLAVARGQLLRDALQVFLSGFGACKSDLARHRDGQLVQWGAQLLGGEYIVVLESRGALPPPDVVHVPGERWESRLHEGWARQTMYLYPSGNLGRWTWARNRIKRNLDAVMFRRRLPLPAGSPLNRERQWMLARLVMQNARRPFGAGIPVAELREVLDPMMEQVNRTARSTWLIGGDLVDSDDVRWLHARIQQAGCETFAPSWPLPDRPAQLARWRWQGYSPGMTRSVAEDVLRDAVTGYRDLVDHNFARFGGALSLNSVLPVRVEGIAEVLPDDPDGSRSGLAYQLKPDPGADRNMAPAVEITLSETEHGRYNQEFTAREGRNSTPFYRPLAFDTWLPTGADRPATNLAYQWLAADLHNLGWLDQPQRFDN